MKRETVPVYAHRGASAVHVENTFAAFKKAKELGAAGIELDVQLSKDHVLVVFHDSDLKRLAGVNKKVAQCKYEELMRYRLGSRFRRFFSRAHIVSLEDVLTWANAEKIALNIELKESLLGNLDVLTRALQTMELPENSHFSSFHQPLLETVKKERPEMETAYIITKKFDWATVGSASFYDVVHAHKRYYKERYLAACEAADTSIRFYGITGAEAFVKNPHPAVIGWITDFPDKVQRAQKKVH